MEKEYHLSLEVPASAKLVVDAINDVKHWWTADLTGYSEKPGDEFTVTFGETWITLKITEMIADKKIAWLVTDCYKHWLKDKKEWQNTKITWEITESTNTSLIDFTHAGLVPGMECYKGCEKAWDSYLKENLIDLISESKEKIK